MLIYFGFSFPDYIYVLKNDVVPWLLGKNYFQFLKFCLSIFTQTLLVKTAHKDFPQRLVQRNWNVVSGSHTTLKVMEWWLAVSETSKLKILYLHASPPFQVSSDQQSIMHHGLVNWLHVVEQYLQAAAAISIHNHNWSGSAALEDVWHTKNPRRRQLAGILCFCFTNGFLAMKYFTDKNLKHHTFKMAAAQALTNYHPINLCKTRQLEKSSITEDALHMMAKLPKFRNCYYCWHGYSTPWTNCKSTTFKCVQCNVSLYKPSKVIAGSFI